MSRAAVEQRKQAKTAARRTAATERFFAMAEYSSRADSAVVTCDSCGLLQVTHQGLDCFMCESPSATSAA